MAAAVVASVYRTFRDMLGEIDSKATWMRASLTELEEEYVKARTRAREAEEERDNANEERDAYGALVAELRHERDEAREQRDAISDQREDLANEILVERAARLRAEAEVKRLNDRRYDYRWPDPDTGEVMADPWLTAEECIAKYRASDVALRERLAAAEAEVKSREADILWWKARHERDVSDLRDDQSTLRERIARLVEAGDAMVHTECYDWPGHVARWLAAKADAPAAKETK
jgi:predicted  nucleic acid-binding Zn-ribbon protein